MTANRKLAQQRGISEETCKQIDYVHECIDDSIRIALEVGWSEDFVKENLAVYEEELQRLWNFPVDPRFHTYFKKYQFIKKWAGKKYRCNTTGQQFKVPLNVSECAFFQWAEAFVDVGRLNSYSRFSNCTEISKEEHKVNGL